MFPALLAARTTWIGAVFVLLGVGVLWLFFKAGVDLVHWFREEIIEDFREGRRRKKKRNETIKDKR